jgi:hypothetical protein
MNAISIWPHANWLSILATERCLTRFSVPLRLKPQLPEALPGPAWRWIGRGYRLKQSRRKCPPSLGTFLVDRTHPRHPGRSNSGGIRHASPRKRHVHNRVHSATISCLGVIQRPQQDW